MHSTRYALDRGAVEGNPAIKGVTGTTAGMAAVKAAGTAGVIFVSEKLRTKNKAAAIGLMIASNSMMSWVVQHNYRAVRLIGAPVDERGQTSRLRSIAAEAVRRMRPADPGIRRWRPRRSFRAFAPDERPVRPAVRTIRIGIAVESVLTSTQFCGLSST